jgi:hypothetical protein
MKNHRQYLVAFEVEALMLPNDQAQRPAQAAHVRRS